jgi:predicted NBD/HSP70 family sugar kinase
MRQFLTIDTGGTKTRIVQFGGDFTDVGAAFTAPVLHEIEIPTPHDQHEYITQLAATIQQNFADFVKTPEGNVVILATRGVVTNGLVNDERLGWYDSPVAQILSDKLGCRVLAQNDARIGALGAFPSNFTGRGLYLTLGTGIGSGLVINGELSYDLVNLEAGHMMIERGGKFASWESFASGTAWFERSDGREGHEVPADDPIWHWYADNLATGIVTLLPVLYPDTIALAGSMAELFDNYAEPLRQMVAERAWPPVAKVEIVVASDPRLVTNRGALVFGLRQMEKMDEN